MSTLFFAVVASAQSSNSESFTLVISDSSNNDAQGSIAPGKVLRALKKSLGVRQGISNKFLFTDLCENAALSETNASALHLSLLERSLSPEAVKTPAKFNALSNFLDQSTTSLCSYFATRIPANAPLARKKGRIRLRIGGRKAIGVLQPSHSFTVNRAALLSIVRDISGRHSRIATIASPRLFTNLGAARWRNESEIESNGIDDDRNLYVDDADGLSTRQLKIESNQRGQKGGNIISLTVAKDSGTALRFTTKQAARAMLYAWHQGADAIIIPGIAGDPVLGELAQLIEQSGVKVVSSLSATAQGETASYSGKVFYGDQPLAAVKINVTTNKYSTSVTTNSSGYYSVTVPKGSKIEIYPVLTSPNKYEFEPTNFRGFAYATHTQNFSADRSDNIDSVLERYGHTKVSGTNTDIVPDYVLRRCAYCISPIYNTSPPISIDSASKTFYYSGWTNLFKRYLIITKFGNSAFSALGFHDQAPGTVHRTYTITSGAKPTTIKGKVLTNMGDPIQNCKLEIRPNSPNTIKLTNYQATTGTDGSYSFSGVPEGYYGRISAIGSTTASGGICPTSSIDFVALSSDTISYDHFTDLGDGSGTATPTPTKRPTERPGNPTLTPTATIKITESPDPPTPKPTLSPTPSRTPTLTPTPVTTTDDTSLVQGSVIDSMSKAPITGVDISISASLNNGEWKEVAKVNKSFGSYRFAPVSGSYQVQVIAINGCSPPAQPKTFNWPQDKNTVSPLNFEMTCKSSYSTPTPSPTSTSKIVATATPTKGVSLTATPTKEPPPLATATATKTATPIATSEVEVTIQGQIFNTSTGYHEGGVAVEISNSQNQKTIVTSDPYGWYRFTSAISGATYIIRPYKSGYIFTPTSRTVTPKKSENTYNFNMASTVTLTPTATATPSATPTPKVFVDPPPPTSTPTPIRTATPTKSSLETPRATVTFTATPRPTSAVKGSVNCQVYDNRGAFLPQVNYRVFLPSGDLLVQGVSGSDGKFVISNVSISTKLRIEVSKSGYSFSYLLMGQTVFPAEPGSMWSTLAN